MKRNIVLGLTVFFLLIVNVSGMSLKPSGDIKGGRGDEIVIYLTFNKTKEEEDITGIEGILSYDENILTLKSQEKLLNDSWTYYNVVNNKKFAFLNLNWNEETILKTSKVNLSKLIFSINPNASYGNTNLTISKLEAADKLGNSVNISGGSHTVKVLSNVNTLSNIKISGVNIDNFDSNKLEYSKTVDGSVNSIEITADKIDANSTISGVGVKNLNYGLNTFKIVVTSELGTKKEYILNITRKDNRSSINTLKSLSLSTGTINFKSTTNTYNLNVSKNTEKIKINSELSDSKSSYVSGYGNREIILKSGVNTVLIKVQAENGSINTYTLNITREIQQEIVKGNNANIKELTISNHQINFSSNIYKYDVYIQDENKLEFKIVLQDSKATYQILNNQDLKDGSIITINVTSEDKNVVKKYEFVIKKEENIIDNENTNNEDDTNNENNEDINNEDDTNNENNEDINNNDETNEDNNNTDNDMNNNDSEFKDNDKMDNKTKKYFDYIIGISVLIIGIVLFISSISILKKSK